MADKKSVKVHKHLRRLSSGKIIEVKSYTRKVPQEGISKSKVEFIPDSFIEKFTHDEIDEMYENRSEELDKSLNYIVKILPQILRKNVGLSYKVSREKNPKREMEAQWKSPSTREWIKQNPVLGDILEFQSWQATKSLEGFNNLYDKTNYMYLNPEIRKQNIHSYIVREYDGNYNPFLDAVKNRKKYNDILNEMKK